MEAELSSAQACRADAPAAWWEWVGGDSRGATYRPGSGATRQGAGAAASFCGGPMRVAAPRTNPAGGPAEYGWPLTRPLRS